MQDVVTYAEFKINLQEILDTKIYLYTVAHSLGIENNNLNFFLGCFMASNQIWVRNEFGLTVRVWIGFRPKISPRLQLCCG